MANDEKLSGLTKSLLVGVSLGAITLTQVGCAPVSVPSVAAGTTEGSVKIYTGSEKEQQLCSTALRTKSVADVNRFLTSYPNSRCIAPLLNSLPTRTLAGLSMVAVKGVTPSVLRSLPARVAASLPGAKPPATTAGAVRSGEAATQTSVRY